MAKKAKGLIVVFYDEFNTKMGTMDPKKFMQNTSNMVRMNSFLQQHVDAYNAQRTGADLRAEVEINHA